MDTSFSEKSLRSRRVDQPQGRSRPVNFISLKTFLSANLMFLGGFFALLFLNTQPQAEDLLLPEPSTTPTVDYTETATPFQASPLTSTPTASPTVTPTPTITPTRTPTHTPVPPPSHRIKGIVGYSQALPLSCESSSAVDWARYFGKSINELDFFWGLPVSDNPDQGFVGNVYGSWGQIPPAPYGVHAKPIAHRLREYNLKAKAVRGMSLAGLKAEIAAGRPVIVWVVGHVNRGTPIAYTARNGHQTTVAKFEHTVIVIGYTEHKITVLDGSMVYSRYNKEFRRSWRVLGNQAVIMLE